MFLPLKYVTLLDVHQKLGQHAEMWLENYKSRLTAQLCWYCHVPTTKSHRSQRQCPKCRRKLSYRNRMIEFWLLEAFCSHHNPHETSRAICVAYGTAYKHFERFEMTVRKNKPELWDSFKESSKEPDAKNTMNNDVLKFLYFKLIWPNEVVRKA